MPAPVYTVSGTLTPDATSPPDYIYAGIIDGRPYQHRIDGAYFIFWSEYVSAWYLTDSITFYTLLWQRVDDNIVGDYEPVSGVVGTATVALGIVKLCGDLIIGGQLVGGVVKKTRLTMDKVAVVERHTATISRAVCP
jgi:hypothetical protein